MNDIKKQLLSNLDDITTLFDYNNSNTQYLTLKSKYEEYELMVDVVCYTKESIVEGNYHNNLKSFEGSGIIYEISDIEILNIEIFLNNELKHVMITFYEMSEIIRQQYEQ